MIEINKYKLVPAITATWGEIVGDITKQQDLVDYVASHGGGGASVWGQITGDIEDQEDLAELLDEYAKKEWVEQRGYLVQSDLSQYATKDWVAGQGYINQIKTINNQSLIGEGKIEVSGLTPEQEDAIDPLMNPEGGMLYTRNIDKNFAQVIYSQNVPTDYRSHLYNIDGDIYLRNGNELYVFEDSVFDFKKLGYFEGDLNGDAPVWSDLSGRVYQGVTREYDFINNTLNEVNLNCNGYSYEWSSNRHSLWKGQYGVYNLRSIAQKFDEDDKRFVGWTIDFENCVTSDTDNLAIQMAKYGVEYDGHHVVWYDGYMYEMTEYEDRILIEGVDDPYFPGEIDGTALDPYYFFVVSGDLYYLKYDSKYLFTGDSWTPVDMKIYIGGWMQNFYVVQEPGKGVVYGDYIIGIELNVNDGAYTIINVKDNEEKTYWAPVTQNVVDLSSTQYISGSKSFDTMVVGSINIDSVYTRSNSTNINLGNNNTTARNISLNVSGSVTLNDDKIATVEDCIMNTAERPYGSRIVRLETGWNPDPYMYSYWRTHTGRLFYGSEYEFDGSHWNQLSTPIEVDGGPGWLEPPYIVISGNNTFMNVHGYTYIWDDVSYTFTQIADNSPGASQWGCWPCDGTLRYEGGYKLVNNGGTWSWESDPIQDYHYGMTHYIDGNVYVLCNDNSTVYQYDETSKTYTRLGTYLPWTMTSWVVGGDILYPWNGEMIRKIDFSKVGVSDEISVETSVPYSQYDYFHGEWNGHLYTYWNYSTFGYCYDIEYSLPEVPAAMGNYVLGATRDDGDDVSYNWESGNLMKLVDKGLDYDVVDRPNGNWSPQQPDNYVSAGYILSLYENYDTIEEDGDDIRRKFVNYISCEDQNLFQRQFVYHEVDGEWELQEENEYQPAWTGGGWDVTWIHVLPDDPYYRDRLDDFPIDTYFDIGWDKLPFGRFDDDGEALSFNGFCWDQENEKLGLYSVEGIEEDPEEAPGVITYQETFIPFVAAEEPDTSTDATYVLKATVLDGEVTYEWVPEV